jgi:orotidine-5'-phosphate decarboxylase
LREFTRLERKTGIILALDLSRKDAAVNLVRTISNNIDGVKVGLPLVLGTGINIVSQIKSVSRLPVIADFKVCDIPYIAKRIVKIAIDAGCDGVIVHGFMGPDGVEACVREAKRGMIFVATELTNPGGQIFTQPVAEDIAVMAKELGAYGIQAPGTRPDRITKLRQTIGKDLVIIACGIGAQGPTPGTAIRAGADFEIIGRAIYESRNPLEIVRNSKNLIQKVMKQDFSVISTP